MQRHQCAGKPDYRDAAFWSVLFEWIKKVVYYRILWFIFIWRLMILVSAAEGFIMKGKARFYLQRPRI